MITKIMLQQRPGNILIILYPYSKAPQMQHVGMMSKHVKIPKYVTLKV